MRIGVFLDQEPRSGGEFNQTLTTAMVLNKHSNDKISFEFFTSIRSNVEELAKFDIRANFVAMTPWDKLIARQNGTFFIYRQLRRFSRKVELKMDRAMKAFSIGLIYFLGPSYLSVAVDKHNYLFTVWDTCYRDHPEFPEVRSLTGFKRREDFLRLATQRAFKIIVDSEKGKSDLIARFAIDTDRIIVLPYLPSHFALSNDNHPNISKNEIKKKYNITGDYIFYPAQFWAHKNHVYILDGLKILKEKYNLKIQAVFFRKRCGKFEQFEKLCKECRRL